MRTGSFNVVTLAAGNNPSVIPANPKRTYISFSGSFTSSLLVIFRTSGIDGATGYRMTNSQPPLEFRRENIGTLITQPISLWNTAGSPVNAVYIEGYD